jgi:CDP-glucose 4,6-dehydratase
LGWRPKLDLPTTLEWIIEWTRRYQAGEGMLDTSLADIERYMAISASD